MPERLEEQLAHRGWLPLAAALFGTAQWRPQWMHSNFLPVIGLRLHAKLAPSPLTDHQVVMLLGMWERTELQEPRCRSLANTAPVQFGPPAQLRDGQSWTIQVADQGLDLIGAVLRRYTGAHQADPVPEREAEFMRGWMAWVGRGMGSPTPCPEQGEVDP